MYTRVVVFKYLIYAGKYNFHFSKWGNSNQCFQFPSASNFCRKSRGLRDTLHFSTLQGWHGSVNMIYCTDWRNDFWVCPFPIKRSTTPSKFSVYFHHPNWTGGSNANLRDQHYRAFDNPGKKSERSWKDPPYSLFNNVQFSPADQ